ncbi:MAG: CBS domain-containing protein [Rubrobacter sp.]|nr:CBS domain-containing protein [Rubrobacter sp.]
MKSSAVASRLTGLLDNTPAFDRLPKEVRGRLLGEVLVRYYEKDQVILAQGYSEHEFLYIMESGSVRLTDAKTGRLVDEYGEGEMFGNYGLMKGGPLPFEARAVEPVVCVQLASERFRELYATYEPFAAFFDKDIRGYAPDSEDPFDAAGTSGTQLLFGTRLGELVSRGPVVCSPEATVREAARSMREEGANSVLVARDGQVVGILSDIDLRNKVVAEDAPVETPVGELMSGHIIRLDADAPVFKALMEMMQQRAYHVVVSEGPGAAERGSILGVISDQDISRAQGNSPAFITERIERSRSVAELSGLRQETDKLLMGLDNQSVRPEDLITINTEINDRLMRRVIGLVEEELKEAAPELQVDLPWVWLSLGSEGRGEQSLVTDQDNALIYADPSSPTEAERAEEWFRTLAERANAALDRSGFALCKGGIMARNSRWRQPLGAWKETFRRWVLSPDREEVMQASTFFDLRGLYGDMSLVEDLRSSILESLRKERRFLPFLAQEALANRPPLSFFRRFVVERSGAYRHTFNIKRRGLRPLADAARLLAIELRYLESTNTVARLRYAATTLPELSKSMEDALDAYHYLGELRMNHQLDLLKSGKPTSNQINPSFLTNTQQSMLKVVFSVEKEVQDEIARRYGVDPRM